MAKRSGKSAAVATLREVGGGRPFAWLPTGFLAMLDLNGTERFVLAALYATARYQDSTAGQEAAYVETPRGGWGPWLGLSERTARNAFSRLIEAGALHRLAWGKRRGMWELDASALALKDAAGNLRHKVELAPMGYPGWTCAMRATWIALCWHAQNERGRLECYPGQKALAEGAGMARSSLQDALYRIKAAGFLQIRQRRGTSLYTLYPHGGAPDTGKNPGTLTGKNPGTYRQESGHLPARIRAPYRQESGHELEPLNLNSELEPRTGTRELRSRRSGANVAAVENSPRRLEFEAEWHRLTTGKRR